MTDTTLAPFAIKQHCMGTRTAHTLMDSKSKDNSRRKSHLETINVFKTMISHALMVALHLEHYGTRQTGGNRSSNHSVGGKLWRAVRKPIASVND